MVTSLSFQISQHKESSESIIQYTWTTLFQEDAFWCTQISSNSELSTFTNILRHLKCSQLLTTTWMSWKDPPVNARNSHYTSKAFDCWTQHCKLDNLAATLVSFRLQNHLILGEHRNKRDLCCNFLRLKTALQPFYPFLMYELTLMSYFHQVPLPENKSSNANVSGIDNCNRNLGPS